MLASGKQGWSESSHSGIQDTIECQDIVCYVVLLYDNLVILTLHVESHLYWLYSPRDISLPMFSLKESFLY